jgi:tRNA(Ile)-lysidine synthase
MSELVWVACIVALRAGDSRAFGHGNLLLASSNASSTWATRYDAPMSTSPLIPVADLLQTGHAPLLVGLSGGLDSVVLLHALASLSEARARGLRAVHVHHGLHPDADAWQRHCESLCAAWQVPLRSARVEVARNHAQGPEAAARHARHAAFAAELGDDEVLALAHHGDDQAETFLLRALRGSGVDGLGAMQSWRRFGHGWLWRPLLAHSRADLQAYAQAHELPWIEDPSNRDTRFDRNFLRQHVLPLLRERWPHADAAFARSARLCAEANELLDTEDTAALARVRTCDAHVLSRSALLHLPSSRRARVLRRWIGELGLPPLPEEGVARIEAELLAARADAEPQFAWQRARVRAWRDLLHADRIRPALPMDWTSEWDGTAPLVLPDGSLLRLGHADAFAQPLQVHARQGGERINLPGREHSHALKHVLQDLGVPPWERERLPLVSSLTGELLAAGDLVYSAGFDAWLRERGARLIWLRD